MTVPMSEQDLDWLEKQLARRAVTYGAMNGIPIERLREMPDDIVAPLRLLAEFRNLQARVLQLEIVAALAAEVVRADEGASIAQDWNLVLLWDRIVAMKAALAELGGTPGLQKSGVEGTPSQQNPIGTASESSDPEKGLGAGSLEESLRRGLEDFAEGRWTTFEDVDALIDDLNEPDEETKP